MVDFWYNYNMLITFFNFRTLFSKFNDSVTTRYYTISVSQTSIKLDYHPQELQVADGENMFRSVTAGTLEDIDLSIFWHHITVTVYMEDVTYYINGSVVSTSTLEAPIADGPGYVYLGEVSSGIYLCYKLFISYSLVQSYIFMYSYNRHYRKF